MLTPPEHLVADPDCFALCSTPRGPGAIAIVDLIGDVRAGLGRLFPERPPGVGSLSHRKFGDFDDGVVAVLSDDRAQLCPHGGPRVLQRLRDWLAGGSIGWLEDASGLDPQEIFPEAGDRVEAFALAAMTRASSRLAVRLLLAQSEVWKATSPTEADRPRSLRLRRLLVPPRVAVVGAPNAGKSTLSNTLIGRTMSIASPEPGTTRDYLSARIDLDGLVVDWFDTPGLGATSDPIEAEAQQLARSVIASADLLVAVAAPGSPWPDLGERQPDLRILTKRDLAAGHERPRPLPDLEVSALTGEGIPDLVSEIRERLVPSDDLASERPWIFDDRLVPGS